MASAARRVGYSRRTSTKSTVERRDSKNLPDEQFPDYVEDCYLCPGNRRVSGARNPDYSQTFVFDNDHPCVGT